MPLYFKIDDDHKRIYTRCEGIVTYDELRAHMNAEVGAEAASYSEVFDCSDAVTSITENEIIGLAAEREEVALRQKPGPVAVVATDDDFFNKLQMFDSLTEQIRPMQLFRYTIPAERWLDEISHRWGDA